MSKLTPDAQVPALSLPLVGGGTWTLADQKPKHFTMIVVYRGYHCPVCKAYLTKLNTLVDMANEAGVTVVAASMDPQERAEKTKEEWGLDNLDIAYGLSRDDVRNWGLYFSTSIKEAENEEFAEPGLFWVRPDGRLYLVDISNMPWPRPDVEFLLSKVGFAMENNYPARGTATP
ncbi:MAG: AhpC/TSA family protein [Rhodobacteraceae bacterium]|nr:AhpC/TSA family protein [Paracoccaceae bacterium]